MRLPSGIHASIPHIIPQKSPIYFWNQITNMMKNYRPDIAELGRIFLLFWQYQWHIMQIRVTKSTDRTQIESITQDKKHVQLKMCERTDNHLSILTNQMNRRIMTKISGIGPTGGAAWWLTVAYQQTQRPYNWNRS